MTTFSALEMYGFDELKEAWNALYAAAATRISGAPPRLSWGRDLASSWIDPQLALGQTCGWPLVTVLAPRVQVIGTFAHSVGDPAVSAWYRSVLVAREARPLSAFAAARAAVNGFDSLSGWISLRVATQFAGATIVTGTHRASIEAVAAGHADIASIDAVTWSYAQTLWPDETRPLVAVGYGPKVPCLPLITSITASTEQISMWRAALTAAVANQPEACRALGIAAFVALDLNDYQRALAAYRDVAVRR